MSCNGGPVDRFDLNKDPGLFHDVCVTLLLWDAPHRNSPPTLGRRLLAQREQELRYIPSCNLCWK